jgi:very-short-patch-repair endonuclease
MAHTRIINESKHLHGADLNTKSKARRLRKSMTAAEKTLWNKLRRGQLNGMYFRRQHPYGNYILDFFCHEANLVVEVDGAIHMSSKEYDEERTQYLESTGLRVIRFKNDEIQENVDNVIKTIYVFLNHHKKLMQ